MKQGEGDRRAVDGARPPRPVAHDLRICFRDPSGVCGRMGRDCTTGGRVRTEAGLVAGSLRVEDPSRRVFRDETLIVLALSLGASAVSSLISFIGSLTRPGALKEQAATLNGSYAPGRPWLDLTWQLFGIATALVPVVLVAHLLLREGAGTRGLRAIGFDRTRPWPDLGRGALVASGIGSAGLAFYLGARAAG